MKQIVFPQNLNGILSTYKVVQVLVDGNIPCMRFSKNPISEDKEYHADILRNFLKESMILYKENKDKQPDKKGERYELVGAGYASILNRDKQLHFSGDSTGYGLKISKKHLDSLVSAMNGWDISVAKD